MKLQKTISETLGQYDGDWPPKDAAGALAWFWAKLADVPTAFLSTARIEIGSEEGYTTIEISYVRPETNEEEAEREQQAAALAERVKAPFVSRVIAGERPPTNEMLRDVGIELVAVYKPPNVGV